MNKQEKLAREEAKAEAAARNRALRGIPLSHLAELMPKKEKAKKRTESGSGNGYNKFLK